MLRLSLGIRPCLATSWETKIGDLIYILKDGRGVVPWMGGEADFLVRTSEQPVILERA